MKDMPMACTGVCLSVCVSVSVCNYVWMWMCMGACVFERDLDIQSFVFVRAHSYMLPLGAFQNWTTCNPSRLKSLASNWAWLTRQYILVVSVLLLFQFRFQALADVIFISASDCGEHFFQNFLFDSLTFDSCEAMKKDLWYWKVQQFLLCSLRHLKNTLYQYHPF